MEGLGTRLGGCVVLLIEALCGQCREIVVRPTYM